jgi:hypothetical protein
MKILIEISPEYYDSLLSCISTESPMYAVLKNGVVIHPSEADTTFRIIEILCEKFHARMLLTIAEELCPEAVPQLEEGIRLSRTLH